VVQKSLVFHKSAKGSEAIATRQHGLSPKLRSLLIMIDGKRGVDELARVSGTLGDAEVLLGQLLEQGFIEPVAASEAPGAAAPGKAAAPASARGPSLVEAQRYASRRLFDLLGPSSEPACLRIEAARNPQDLQAAIKLAEVMVNDVRSGKVAAEFAAEMQAHMPAP
jgi:hypothetical protein